MKQEVSVELAGGKRLTFETGRMAKQAPGAVLVSQGDSVVLVTAVASPEPREGIDFFPLTVDYREYTYAGGRIPGGFIKREGRPSEKEILTSRQIDRPIRPLFPETFRNETQVIALVFSADKENDPDVIAINGAGAALALSDIPFGGPVGAVRVGRVNDEFVINPTYAERHESTLNIMVVGTKDGIVMVESGAKEVSEEIVVDAIDFGHEEIKKIVAAIEELVAKAGKTKRTVAEAEVDHAYASDLDAKVGTRLKDALDTKAHPKAESYAMVKAIKDELAKELPPINQTRRRSSASTLRRSGSVSSASRCCSNVYGRTAAHLTKSGRSRSRPACCRAPMARRSSLVARRRHWSLSRSAPPTISSAWRPTKASKRSA